MQSRTHNALHIIPEAGENAIAGALARFGKRIAVTLPNCGSLSVDGDGSGIPVGLPPDG